MKILFILKKHDGYGGNYSRYHSSGLYWSAKFIVDMLNNNGYAAKLVQVTDNNDIDREVHDYKPDTVIIEALWVVPEKFDVLIPLHPTVNWIVRLHSNIPFLATEGIAMDWIKGYVQRGVQVAVNDPRALRDVRTVAGDFFGCVIYLPNYYPLWRRNQTKLRPSNCVNIGCFGAIRPLKNQLLQAITAMEWAEDHNRDLKFHVNATRVEQGENVLKNLRGLFRGTPHVLIEWSWLEYNDFVKYALGNIDFGMQVSLSETFAITAADMASAGIPLVASAEVPWASPLSKAHPTDSRSIYRHLSLADKFSSLNVAWNRHNLTKYSETSKREWFYQLS